MLQLLGSAQIQLEINPRMGFFKFSLGFCHEICVPGAFVEILWWHNQSGDQ
jgi:hypothetical protein